MDREHERRRQETIDEYKRQAKYFGTLAGEYERKFGAEYAEPFREMARQRHREIAFHRKR